MAMQKVEYSFPDEQDNKTDIEVENSSAVEIDVSGKKESSKDEPKADKT